MLLKNYRKPILCSFVICSLLAVCFLRSPEDSLFIHLAAGKHLWQSQSLQTLEPFTYLHANENWHNLFWLSDLLLFLGFAVLGFSSLWLLPWLALWKSSILVSTDRLPTWAIAIVPILLVMGSYPHLSVGPHSFLAIFAISLLFLLNAIEQYPKLAWALPLLVLVWTNCHPSFFFAPLTIALFVGARNVERGERRPISWGLVILAFIAALISPSGYRNLAKAWQYTLLADLSLWHWPGYWLLLFAGVLSLWMLWRGGQKPSLAELLLWIVWLAISCFYSEWTLCCALLQVWLIARTVEKLRNFSLASARKKIGYATVLAIAVGIIALGSANTNIYWGQLDPHRYPIHAGDFLQKLPHQGRIFNDPSLGGYLSWCGFPIFMDDQRKLRYVPEDYQDIALAQIQPESFAQLARRFDITLAVLKHQQSKNSNLLKWLNRQNSWKLLYCDHLVAIFSTDKNREAVAQFAFADGQVPQLSVVSAAALYSRSRFLFSIEWVVSAQRDLEKAIDLAPDLPQRDLLEACTAFLEGQLPRAEEKLAAFSKYPFNEAQALLLLQYLRTLDIEIPEQRQIAYKWTLYLHERMSHPDVEILLAYITDAQGDQTTARHILIRASQKFPKHLGVAGYLEDLEKSVAAMDLQNILDKSMLHRVNRRYQRALQIIDSGIGGHPGEMELYLERGKIHSGRKKYQEACDDFRRVLANVPNHVAARCQLAKNLALMKDWRSAMAELQPLFSSRENTIRSDVRQTLEHVEKIAVPELRERIAQSPQKYSIRKELAEIFARLQKFDEAVAVLRGSNNQDEKFHASLLFMHAKNLLNEGEIGEALQKLRESIAQWPQNTAAYAMIGEIYLQRFEMQKARKTFQRLLQIDPNDSYGREGIALVEYGEGIQLQTEGKLAEAITHFEKYLELAPEGEQSILKRKDVRERLANVRQELAKKQYQQKQQTTLLLFDTAIAAMGQHQWHKAIDAYQQIIAIEPNSVEAHWNLSLALRRVIVQSEKQQRQKYRLAMEQALLKVVELKTDFADAYLNLGSLYLTKDTDQARLYYRKYLEYTGEPEGKTALQVRKILEQLQSNSQK